MPHTVEVLNIEYCEDDFSHRVEVERLSQPILFRAGVLDINRIFNSLPQEHIERCGRYPYIDRGELYPLIFELKSEVYRVLGVNEYNWMGEDFNVKHFLYPVINEGFIGQIAGTQVFKRLFGVYELGLNRVYPLVNPHNRGEHSIFITVNMIRTLQTLFEKDPKKLIERLRRDFFKEDIAITELADEDVLHLATDLVVLVGMLHDLATPAGGDTIKFLLGLDEEKDLRWLLLGDSGEFAEVREELFELLDARNLDKKYLQLVIKCVNGESDSLIGDFINPSEGDKLESDRIGYTLHDALATTILENEVPTALLPALGNSVVDRLVSDRLLEVIEVLSGNYAAVLGVRKTESDSRGFIPIVPTNLIDPSEDFYLDESGHLVCDAPQKLAWISAFRVWMIGMHYAGSQMLGLECELQEKLHEMMKGNKTGDILTKSSLLSCTYDKLLDDLVKIGDEELTGIISRSKSFAITSLFSGRLVDELNELPEDLFAQFPITIKPGLDTLVQSEGMCMTLHDYVETGSDSDAIKMLMSGVEKFDGKTLLIFKR